MRQPEIACLMNASPEKLAFEFIVRPFGYSVACEPSIAKLSIDSSEFHSSDFPQRKSVYRKTHLELEGFIIKRPLMPSLTLP